MEQAAGNHQAACMHTEQGAFRQLLLGHVSEYDLILLMTPCSCVWGQEGPLKN